MNRDLCKYTWLTYRREQLWLPLALFAFFVVIVLFFRSEGARFQLARAYLGFVVPLIGGITAAYAVLDDPALELRFATPIRAETTLLSRVGLILAVQLLSAAVFQVVAYALGIDLTPLGGLLRVQVAWLTPTVTLIALATLGSLAATQTTVGAFLAGACWLVQLTMKSWFETNASHVYLFQGVLAPGHVRLAGNQAVLLALSAAFLWLSWILLRRQERYL